LSHYKKTLDYGNHQLKLETGEIAKQASAAVLVSLGDTVVLVTVVGRKNAKPDQDFFPANRGLYREDLRGRQDSRRFPQA